MTDTKDECPIVGKVDAGTIFSKILNGEMPASFVYRDERCAAFMSIQPVNSGHVLVIPTSPARNLSELDEESAAHLLRIGHRIAKAIRQTDIPCEGINLFLADGEVAGQEVFHVHLHVFPRYEGDGFGLQYGEKNFKFQQRTELDLAACKISKALGEIGDNTLN